MDHYYSKLFLEFETSSSGKQNQTNTATENRCATDEWFKDYHVQSRSIFCFGNPSQRQITAAQPQQKANLAMQVGSTRQGTAPMTFVISCRCRRSASSCASRAECTRRSKREMEACQRQKHNDNLGGKELEDLKVRMVILEICPEIWPNCTTYLDVS